MVETYANAVAALGVDLVERVKMEFRSRDRLQAGVLSLVECAYILRSQGFCPTEPQLQQLSALGIPASTASPSRDPATARGATGSLKVVEQNEVTEISLKTLLAGACKIGRPEPRRAELYAFFQPYDAQDTGFVPIPVFRNLLENVGDCLPPEEVQEILTELTLSNNTMENTVDYKSFIDLITQDL
ncbi:unnamed protein product [Amoebophrya sp. A120]|nr:unnamed protein product [Amoebophrya sp. A120]|eukprot:GSA120T00021622001.1